MKIKGFSLLELLVVMLITAIMISFAFNNHSDAKVRTEIRLERQYLLQLPGLVENYFSQQLEYPHNLADFLVSQNGQFKTPKGYYSIAYTLNGSSYLFTASAVNEMLTNCYRLLIHSSGLLQAYNNDNNDVSAECWD